MRTALRAEEPPITGHDFLSQREIRAYITNCLSARVLVHSLLARLTGTHPSAEFLGAIPLDLYRTLLPLVPPLGDVLTAVAGCLEDAGALRNAEEEYRGPARAVGEDHGDGLGPLGDLGRLHPAVRPGAARAHLEARSLATVDVHGGEGLHRFRWGKP